MGGLYQVREVIGGKSILVSAVNFLCRSFYVAPPHQKFAIAFIKVRCRYTSSARNLVLSHVIKKLCRIRHAVRFQHETKQTEEEKKKKQSYLFIFIGIFLLVK